MSYRNSPSQHRRPLLYAVAIALLVLAPAVRAQATTATAIRKADLQVGGGFTAARSDYGPRLLGGAFYATYDFRPHLGIEFAIHQVNSRNGDKRYERTYEIGGRYVLHYGRFNPYAHAMYGRGVFNFPQDQANLAYNLGAVGGGVDYYALRHVNVRAEYEYQRWFSFPVANAGSLTPQLGTIGAAYRF